LAHLHLQRLYASVLRMQICLSVPWATQRFHSVFALGLESLGVAHSGYRVASVEDI
jgi:hypothetical protein